MAKMERVLRNGATDKDDPESYTCRLMSPPKAEASAEASTAKKAEKPKKKAASRRK